MIESSVEELLKNEVRLPSPPAIALKIIDLVKREDFSFRELGSIIESDPALVARILRVANSSFYGIPKTINSIDKAIAVLGANSLKNIALSFVLTEGFRGRSGTCFDFERFSRRAITAAVAAQLVSAEIGFYSDEIFITSLLQDVGVAAMFLGNKDVYLSVLDERLVNNRPLTVVETNTFGYDHQEVGAVLLKMWGLPESVYLPIRYHHVETPPPGVAKLCRIIQASDRLAAMYCGTNSIESAHEAKQMLSNYFELSDERCAKVVASVAEKSSKVLAEFDIPPGKMRPFSQILQEANQELAVLNFSCEMQVLAYQEATQRAERLANGLKAANENLRNLALRDDLTGLHNHRYFNSVINKELGRSRRYGRPVALVLIDVDDFKEINDRYGHTAGNIVLQFIANNIRRNTRDMDTVVRYAGDEFALLLPETDHAGAMVKAETCRASIASLRVPVHGNAIHVTVSIGVASYDAVTSPEDAGLFAAADRALYHSKQNGRNCVTASGET